MNSRSLRALTLMVWIAAPGLTLAQQMPEGDPNPPNPPIVTEPKPDDARRIDGKVGIDFSTHYIARGIVAEDQGLVSQPYGEIGFRLTQDLRLFGGVWNSLHSEHTDAGFASGGDGSTTRSWYQFNWYAGAGYQLTEGLTVALNFQEFVSPSDAFESAKSVQAVVSYNDTGLWGGDRFALRPYTTVLAELDGKVGNGGDKGVYVELGIEPGYTFENGRYDLTLSAPAKVGLGFSDFYADNERLGYVAVGLKASVPLDFMGTQYGAWTIAASVMYWHYADGVEETNERLGNGDDDIVGTLGVSVAF